MLETQGTADAAQREEVKNALISGIRNNPNFSVVSRSELSQIIQQQGFQEGDEFDDNQAIELGRLVKAQYICVSSINSFNGYEYRITYRLIDIETGETLNGTDVREKVRYIDLANLLDKIAESKLFDHNNMQENASTTVVACGCEIQKQDLLEGAKIPAGWRLPTVKELKCMCENKDNIGGFNFGLYQSKTKKDGYYKGIKFQFCDEAFVLGKGASVRIVRDVKANDSSSNNKLKNLFK